MVVKYPRFFILGNFKMHMNKAMDAPELISSFASLVVLQVISGPAQTAGRTLDFFLGLDIKIKDIRAQPMPWTDHHHIRAIVRDLPGPRQQERPMVLIQPHGITDSNKF